MIVPDYVNQKGMHLFMIVFISFYRFRGHSLWVFLANQQPQMSSDFRTLRFSFPTRSFQVFLPSRNGSRHPKQWTPDRQVNHCFIIVYLDFWRIFSWSEEWTRTFWQRWKRFAFQRNPPKKQILRRHSQKRSRNSFKSWLLEYTPYQTYNSSIHYRQDRIISSLSWTLRWFKRSFVMSSNLEMNRSVSLSRKKQKRYSFERS